MLAPTANGNWSAALLVVGQISQSPSLLPAPSVSHSRTLCLRWSSSADPLTQQGESIFCDLGPRPQTPSWGERRHTLRPTTLPEGGPALGPWGAGEEACCDGKASACGLTPPSQVTRWGRQGPQLLWWVCPPSPSTLTSSPSLSAQDPPWEHHLIKFWGRGPHSPSRGECLWQGEGGLGLECGGMSQPLLRQRLSSQP